MRKPHVPPSRRSNPFSTCWVRPGALPFIALEPAASVSQVIDRLATAGWRGQIVGPHGSGKSTLLHSVANSLHPIGIASRKVDLTVATPSLPASAADECLMLEGFERLSRRQRRVLHRQLLANEARYLVTTHRTWRGWRAPSVIANLSPNVALLDALYHHLTDRLSTPVTLADARRSHCQQRGNLREVWFDLYNLHESRSRLNRTGSISKTYS